MERVAKKVADGRVLALVEAISATRRDGRTKALDA